MLMNSTRLFAGMQERRFDAIVATMPENVTYASGFWAMSQWIRRGPQAYVLTPAPALGEPVVIANGMIFGYGSGEETKQAWPDIGLNFDSSIRAAKSTHATLYVLDGQTGEELYSSGEQITSFNHFSGLTVANGRVYIGTYDGTLYCFGLDDAHRSQ